MMESWPGRYILAFILIISVVMFSPLLYYAERGVYAATSVWMRTVGFGGDESAAPRRENWRSAFVELHADGDPGVMFLDRHTHGQFGRRVPPRARAIAVPVHPSPAWWSMVTMATVGYRRPLSAIASGN